LINLYYLLKKLHYQDSMPAHLAHMNVKLSQDATLHSLQLWYYISLNAKYDSYGAM